ncbi:MAG: hypothetical protein Kow00121_29370 [Elainellaceae cyanobacterium]
MTNNHGTPDRHPETGKARPVPKPLRRSSIPPLRVPSPPPAQPNPKGSESRQGNYIADRQSPASQQAQASPDLRASDREYSGLDGLARSAQATQPIPPKSVPASVPTLAQKFSLRMPKSWLFWGISSVVVFSGLGIFSALALLRLPSTPNCPAIFWPTASASLRIYCAQLRAEKGNVDDLLKAISLVNALPDNHPLRSEIDRNIEEWSEEILKLAEVSFQRGDLSKAVSTAKRIPSDTEAYQLVEQKTQEWQAIWAKAEGIYQDAENALQQQDLRQAFNIATQLLEVGNTYWETKKYQELNNLIIATREDSNKLAKAKGLAEQGGLADFLAALKLVTEVKTTSPLYGAAQKLIAQFGQDMLDLAEATLDKRDYDGAINVVQQIPERAGLKAEIRDFRILAEAQAQAWGGTTDDIEAAIVRAQKLGRDRPLYGRAQQLISYWQLEIQDVERLNTARQIALGGSIGDLRAAIAEAQMVPSFNPRGDEARQAIDQWTAEIQTVEDRPYLTQAEQLARAGDVNALEAAISEASRIGRGRALYAEANARIEDWQTQIQQIQDQPLLNQARYLANSGNLIAAIDVANQISSGRALYDEAQTEISNWSNQVQRTQDQPLLDLARQFANRGNLARAINTAEQISSGRVLYDEAQSEIASWQGQMQGRDRIQQASDMASLGTPTMLLSAIQIANEIPADHSARAEAEQLISRWSWQILQIAEVQARTNPQEAISIARNIPAYTEAYDTAQQEILDWQQQAVPVIRTN